MRIADQKTLDRGMNRENGDSNHSFLGRTATRFKRIIKNSWLFSGMGVGAARGSSGLLLGGFIP
jgi:hypothetical protein